MLQKLMKDKMIQGFQDTTDDKKERLIQIRKVVSSGGASEFARLLEMPQPTYVRYERGDRKFSAELLESLILKLNVNIYWLFTGEGEMFLPQKSKLQIEIENALMERKTFGPRLNYLQGECNATDSILSRETGLSERKIENLGEDKEEPTLNEANALRNFFEKRLNVLISLDLFLYGDGKYLQNSPSEPGLSASDNELLKQLAKKAGII